MGTTKVNNHAQLADFTTDRRVLLLSGMAILIGAISSLVAYVLVWLINVFTNIFYYQRFSSQTVSPAGNLLGYLGRTGLLEARLRKLQEEELRERRWRVAGMPK